MTALRFSTRCTARPTTKPFLFEFDLNATAWTSRTFPLEDCKRSPAISYRRAFRIYRLAARVGKATEGGSWARLGSSAHGRPLGLIHLNGFKLATPGTTERLQLWMLPDLETSLGSACTYVKGEQTSALALNKERSNAISEILEVLQCF